MIQEKKGKTDFNQVLMSDCHLHQAAQTREQGILNNRRFTDPGLNFSEGIKSCPGA